MSFSKPKTPKIPPLPPPPTPESDEVLAARKAEEEMLRKRKGRQSTILTGGLGDTSQATTGTKTLLGQ